MTSCEGRTKQLWFKYRRYARCFECRLWARQRGLSVGSAVYWRLYRGRVCVDDLLCVFCRLLLGLCDRRCEWWERYDGNCVYRLYRISNWWECFPLQRLESPVRVHPPSSVASQCTGSSSEKQPAPLNRGDLQAKCVGFRSLGKREEGAALRMKQSAAGPETRQLSG